MATAQQLGLTGISLISKPQIQLPLGLLLPTLCFALQSTELLLGLVQLCPYGLIGPLQLDVLGLCL